MLHNRQEGELSRVILFVQGRTVATGIPNQEKILHAIWRYSHFNF